MRSYSTLTILDLSCEFEKEKNVRKRENVRKKAWIGNSIGAEGCRIISKMLKENSTLVKVNLMGDERGDELWWSNMLPIESNQRHFMRKATG